MMGEKGMIKRIKDFILKDVENENETKQVSVILRLNALIMCLYFLCVLAILCMNGYFRSLLLLIPCFLAYAAAFFSTYMNKTSMSVAFAHVLMICWIIAFIWDYGWDCGAQHFIFVLVVLCFAVFRIPAVYKVLMSALACLLRLALYFYQTYNEPHTVLSTRVLFTFQIVNTLFIFLLLTVILLLFSSDTLNSETKLVSYNERLHQQASIDPLTGLWNRRYMQEYLSNEVQSYRKNDIQNLSIAIGDIDFFKKVNDQYGHECGDEVLKAISSLLSEKMKGHGTVCRWGGEEFLVVFHDLNGDDALVLLSSLLDQIRLLTVPYGENIVQVTMTFGLSEFDSRRDIDSTINEADEKLYRGKENGRNQIVY